MRPVRAALFAGAAALAVAGISHVAAARDPAAHVMNIQLPTGQIAQIEYQGDVAPRVVFTPAAPSPFAALEAISAQMDQEMASLMHQIETMAAQPTQGSGLTEAAFGNLPPGVTEYESVSTLTPNGVCTRTTSLVAGANGVRPREVSQTSGACGSAPARSVPIWHG